MSTRRSAASTTSRTLGRLGLTTGDVLHDPRDAARPGRHDAAMTSDAAPDLATALREKQAPLKQRYRDDPRGADHARAEGELGEGVACKVQTGDARWPRPACTRRPAATASQLCSGDMLLEALVACAGVTLRAVATALGSPVAAARCAPKATSTSAARSGVDKAAPVGFRDIRLSFDLDTDADDEQLATLLGLTERYCVVLQTIRQCR